MFSPRQRQGRVPRQPSSFEVSQVNAHLPSSHPDFLHSQADGMYAPNPSLSPADALAVRHSRAMLSQFDGLDDDDDLEDAPRRASWRERTLGPGVGLRSMAPLITLVAVSLVAGAAATGWFVTASKRQAISRLEQELAQHAAGASGTAVGVGRVGTAPAVTPTAAAKPAAPAAAAAPVAAPTLSTLPITPEQMAAATAAAAAALAGAGAAAPAQAAVAPAAPVAPRKPAAPPAPPKLSRAAQAQADAASRAASMTPRAPQYAGSASNAAAPQPAPVPKDELVMTSLAKLQLRSIGKNSVTELSGRVVRKGEQFSNGEVLMSADPDVGTIITNRRRFSVL